LSTLLDWVELENGDVHGSVVVFVVENVESISRLEVIQGDASDIFVISLFQTSTSLTYKRQMTGVTL
jgi:hypothetical protein